MCTVTWLRQPHGYDLFFNRDERRTRALAAPPTVRERDGVRFVAPTDGDFGGTWIATNEMGVSVCLMNAYGEGERESADGWTSRGLLVLELASSASIADVRAALEAADLRPFRPFTLVALEPDEPASVVRWDGLERKLDLDADRLIPIVSSSFESQAVTAARSTLLRQMVGTGPADLETLERFHRSHEPEAGPFSVCMHRDDASTVSLSRVAVTADEIAFSYEAGAPCSATASTTLRLRRTPRHSGA